MPTFKYVAYDSSGVKVESEMLSESVESVKKKLEQQNFILVRLTEIKPQQNLFGNLLPRRVSLSDLEFLTAELSILLNSGVKIDKGLEILARNRGSGELDSLVAEISRNLKKGVTVSESFKTKNGPFDTLYTNLIAIGEASGKLPAIFSGLASDLKFKKDLRSKITQALTYPMVILFVCVACLLFVFNYIVPQMGSIFENTDSLPVYTSLLLALSSWMQSYQHFLGLGLVAVVLLFYANRNNKQFREKVASRVLTIPVLSSAIKQIESIRFNSAMALMLDAGMKVDNAIEMATRNIANPIIKKQLDSAKEKIKKGETIATSLAQASVFPPFYVSLIEVGEESGELGRIFSELSQRAKQDFESWTTRITNLLEPLLIIVMGGIVGSVVITMLLSVVSVNDISL